MEIWLYKWYPFQMLTVKIKLRIDYNGYEWWIKYCFKKYIILLIKVSRFFKSDSTHRRQCVNRQYRKINFCLWKFLRNLSSEWQLRTVASFLCAWGGCACKHARRSTQTSISDQHQCMHRQDFSSKRKYDRITWQEKTKPGYFTKY